ncbi:GNAT family N-acetyltransferase [Kitasatospora sp. NPDC002227]|uniref:GNAT family N-acetyltransferase n=1 Tax=Kitasatospora sp. NPDC002227 TaxID=3154773 RepID=UPI003325D390
MGQPQDTIDLGDLTLRRWVPEHDLDSLVQLIDESIDHLRPWMPWTAEHSREATAAYLAHAEESWRAGTGFHYALVAGGRLVGNCSVFIRDPEGGYDPAGREIGYWLHPAATGRGYVTRATEALAAVGLAQPGVEYVEICTDSANARSAAVPQRLGFVEHHRREVEPQTEFESGVDILWRFTPST